MAAEAAPDNPYPGPRPFTALEADLFFGRQREINDLLSLVSAHRLVLIYAASGSGKSSLVGAGLIPRLEQEGFEVLPLVRVRGAEPAVQPANIYVYNALVSLGAENVSDPVATPRLGDFLKQRPHLEDDEGFQAPRVMICDQFEELFTFYGDRWQHRRPFFEQLDQALRADPLLRVVLIMREDFIAQLEPYSRDLPDALRVRYRLERLKYTAALRAVCRPLEDTARRFAPEVAEELVTSLLKVRIENEAGELVEVPGEFVEPVHLQVVCHTLWEELPNDALEITRGHLLKCGDPVATLAAFYEKSLRRTVAVTEVHEGSLRRWFEEVLITSAGTRGTVHRGPETTGGFPNAVLDRLEDCHLIRGDWRAGLRWYELNHDRFIEPIQHSNRHWLEARGSAEHTRQRLEGLAATWVAAGRASSHYLDATELPEAERWQASPEAAELGQSEDLLALVQASRTAAEAREAARRQEIEHGRAQAAAARRLKQLAAALTVALLIAVAAATMALKQRQDAKEAARLAETSQKLAEDNQQLAQVNEQQAIASRQRAEQLTLDLSDTQSKLLQAEADRLRAAGDSVKAAEYETRVAELENMTATLTSQGSQQADALTQQRQLTDEAEQRAEAAEQRAIAAEADRDDLRRQLEAAQLASSAAATAPQEVATIASPRLTPEAEQAVREDTEFGRRVVVAMGQWAANSGEPVSPLIEQALQRIVGPIWTHETSGDLKTVAFHPSLPHLAYAGEGANRPRIWNVETAQEVLELEGFPGNVESVAFSPNGERIAAAGRSQVSLWDTATGLLLQTLPNTANGVVFSPDGRQVATTRQTLPNRQQSMTSIWPLDPAAELSPRHLDIPANDGRQHLISPFGLDLDFSPDGRFIAAAGSGLYSWELAQEDEVNVLIDRQQQVRCVAFSPDGRRIAADSTDKNLAIWDAETGQQVQTLFGHDKVIWDVAFSSRGDRLATASADRTVKVWDATAGQVILTLEGHGDTVTAVDFSSGGWYLASASKDNSVRVFTFDLEVLLVRARASLSAELIDDECLRYLGIATCPRGTEPDVQSTETSTSSGNRIPRRRRAIRLMAGFPPFEEEFWTDDPPPNPPPD